MSLPPPAARMGDIHQCPLYDGKTAHVGGQILVGESSVLVGGQPAARVGDAASCQSEAPNSVAASSDTVHIGGRPAARSGDVTSHGGLIVGGCPHVRIGG